ncbi:phospholipase D-like domain-containing protein [Fodinibacter luteus]|uniref:Phospholipase D-like domain-containing protein n=1 Tax=Fodinibacter luteus TaxID=552064 RepID=A0ABP8K4E7_9MICO
MLPDLFLTPDERDNPHTRIDAHHADGVAWSTGNDVRPVVHGRPYFAELHERVEAMGEGDLLLFADWRGDPDQLLTDDPASTVSATFAAAARRGVDVRGLLWRSHWSKIGFHAEKARLLGVEIDEAGGQCLRDMRVRTAGSHHQKIVVLRHRDDPSRDIAYLGGIDLCHSRRDGIEHEGDRQVIAMPQAFGPRPPWHDVHIAVRGPAVFDVETVFRERWEDSTPLTLNPGRLLSSLSQGEDLTPRPLPEQAPPPPSPDGAREAVQILRTYPAILPKGYDFAPQGERSVAHGNTKAVRHARRLIYLEDQYLWSREVGRHFGDALRENPGLRLIAVIPMVPDVDGAVSMPPQLYGRQLAMDELLDAGGDRVAVYGLTSEAGYPVYVHSKVCVIDDVWASVGSDNFNRRSWTSDSEIAAAIQDVRVEDREGSAPRDVFALRIRRELVGEHVGIHPDDVPDDHDELWDLMAASAQALDAWYAGGAAGRRHRRPHLPGAPMKGTSVRWRRRGRAWTGLAGTERPPGRLRRIDPPQLSRTQLLWAPRLYDVFDPDGTVLRDDEI